MFICIKCLEENYNNFAIAFSKGKCEDCGKTTVCCDIPSLKLVPKENINPITTKPMEKTIKMSLETARKFYADGNPTTIKWLLENFTKEELEGKKGFTWEESVNNSEGFYIEWDKISPGIVNPLRAISKCLFKTEKQALSALAFAQLTHICAKYNEGSYASPKGGFTIFYSVTPASKFGGFGTIESSEMNLLHLPFNRREDALTSIEVNRELWEQYYML